VSGLNRPAMVADFCAEQDPGVEGSFGGFTMRLCVCWRPLRRCDCLQFRVEFGVRTNSMRGSASGTAYGCTGGGKPWRENPMSGSGMKQGRQAWGGSRRQEVETTWRRKRLGVGSPGSSCGCFMRGYAVGAKNLMGGSRSLSPPCGDAAAA